ncbi:MAG: tripartite tricarboxylate transporter substrate binding protein [Pseudomonadota bacterium]
MAPTPSPAALRRRTLLQSAAAWTTLPLAGALHAQAWPARPVKILLPQPPGGAADRVARLFGEKLQARWGQPIVIENRPGGGVVVGTQALVHSAPDGYTLGLLGSSLSINAAQRRDLPYDSLKDILPLAFLGYYTVALVATPGFPANSVPELIALAKAQPGRLAFGSNGIGTSAQLAGEMLNHMAGISLTHVPYNGAAKMYTDIIGGQVPVGFAVASSAESFVKSGQLKVLAVTSRKRSQLYPQWPAIAETLPGYEAINWAGFTAPAGVPRPLVQQLGADILAVLAQPEVARSMADIGVDVGPLGPDEFRTYLQDEITRFSAITKPLATGK